MDLEICIEDVLVVQIKRHEFNTSCFDQEKPILIVTPEDIGEVKFAELQGKSIEIYSSWCDAENDRIDSTIDSVPLSE